MCVCLCVCGMQHLYKNAFYYINCKKYQRAVEWIGFVCTTTSKTSYNITNGAKLGDATVARAPPLLHPPRKFIV